MVPSLEKKGDYYEDLYLSIVRRALLVRTMVERVAFFIKPMHHCH